MSANAIRMGRAFVEIGGDTSPLARTLQGAKSMMQSWGDGLMKIGSGMLATGLSMAGALTPAITTFADYEQALADLRAASNPLPSQFEQIKAKIEDVSRATGMSPVEVTQAFSELIKAGRTVDEVVGGMGETVVKFARVSGMTTAETAVVLSDALNQFGGNAMEAANIMNRAADASTISLREVADAFAQGGSVAGLFSQTMLDTATAIAIMGNAGIKGAQAGTALKTFLTRVATGVAENGTDEVAQAMRRLGLNVRDAEGKMLPLPEILARIQAGLAGLSKAEQDQTLKQLAGMRGILGLAPLIRAGANGFLSFQASMSSALSIEEKFDIMTNTLWGQLKRLWVHIQFVAIAIGEALAPAMRAVMLVAMPFLNGLAQFLQANRSLAQSFAFDAVKAIIFGAALLGLGIAFQGIAFALAGLKAAFLLFWGVVGFIASAVGFLFTPMGAALLAIGIAVVGLVAYFGKWDSSLGFMTNVVNLFKQFGGFLLGIWKTFRDSPFGDFTMKAMKVATAIGAVIGVLTILAGIGAAVSAAWLFEKWIFTLQVLWEVASNVFGFFWDVLKRFSSFLGDFFGMLTTIGGIIQDAIGGALSMTMTLATELFDRLFATGSQAWQAIKDAFAAGDWELAFRTIGIAARLMFNDLTFFLTQTFYTWKDAMIDAFNGALAAIDIAWKRKSVDLIAGLLAPMLAARDALSPGSIAREQADAAIAATGLQRRLESARRELAEAEREERRRTAMPGDAAFQVNQERYARDLAIESQHNLSQRMLQQALDFASYDAWASEFWQAMLPDDQQQAQYLREIRDINLDAGESAFAEMHQAALEDLSTGALERAVLSMPGPEEARRIAGELPELAGLAASSFGSFSGAALSGYGMASPLERVANETQRTREILERLEGIDEDGNDLLRRLVDQGTGLVAE